MGVTVTKLFAMSGPNIMKSKTDLMEEWHMSKRTVEERIAEIEKEKFPGGRYENVITAVTAAGKFMMVNYLVWVDYNVHRVELQQKNLRKHLAPFNPYRVAWELGAYADKELALESVRE